MLEAYVTNLGRYNEGCLDGEYLKLPATKEDVQALLKRIHVDGVQYEETFITDYETDIPGLYECLGEYESIDELNYLASLLEDLDTSEMEKFAAAVELGDYDGSVKNLINLAQNLDCYDFYPAADEEDLGRMYIDEFGTMEVPEHLRNYIDYEAYGRDVALNEGGVFANGGYILNNRDSFIEYYSGDRDDIPDEYKIFAYPKLERQSIMDTLKKCKQMIPSAPIQPKEQPAQTIEER